MSLHCKLFMMPHMQRKTEKKEIIFSFNHTNLYVVMCATHITIKDPQWYSVQECDATMIDQGSSAGTIKNKMPDNNLLLPYAVTALLCALAIVFKSSSITSFLLSATNKNSWYKISISLRSNW